MLSELIERARQGHRTLRFPPVAEAFPTRFRGRPVLDGARCREGCDACVRCCPTGAIQSRPLTLDLGACLLCGACAAACPTGAVGFTRDHRLAASSRQSLVVGAPGEADLAQTLASRARRIFGRSLKLRQVSAGGCNGCEVELNATGNVEYDIGRFGIQFVASPRHADGLVITGPVTQNMELALRKTYAALPQPSLVVVVGACAISGGAFRGAELCRGVPAEIPIDLFIPGCPPHPFTIVDGLLRCLGRIR